MTEHDTDGHADHHEAPVVQGRPATGDDQVDQTLRTLDETLADEDADQVDALSEAHRRLQTRLTSPEPDPPGSARPGPR